MTRRDGERRDGPASNAAGPGNHRGEARPLAVWLRPSRWSVPPSPWCGLISRGKRPAPLPGGPNAVLGRQPTGSMIRGSALPSGSGVCFPDCTASAPRTRTGLQSLLVSAVGAVVLLVHRMKSDSGGDPPSARIRIFKASQAVLKVGAEMNGLNPISDH